MLKVEVSSPSPEGNIHDIHGQPSLAVLSRNASVISSSSSSSSASSLVLSTPRPRPGRTFSSPRSRSPASPTTPRGSRPPAYLTKELGLTDDEAERQLAREIKVSSRANSRPPSKVRGSRNTSASGRVGPQDFEFGKILGEGSYSTVVHAKYRATGQEYAIKVLEKNHLKRNNKLQTALAEKNVLVRLGAGHPGIVRLHWAFHDEWRLYFVLDLARNGEMQSLISRMGSLSTDCARYYAAQIVDAMDYMHGRGVIHRDLKPENLLLDDDFRIKITDFGTGKLVDSGDRAKTFVGTAQYVSPELLDASETSKSSDLWALGCIIYQMVAGRFAFQGLSEYLTWQKIKQLEYSFPEGFDEQAKDLVQKLLVRDPNARLGAGSDGENDIQALRSHPFFSSINWQTLWKDPPPPLEAGLVKKEPADANGINWDMDSSWDNLVNGDGLREDDEMSWGSDEEGAEPPHSQGPEYLNGYAHDVGPMDEVPRFAQRVELEDAGTDASGSNWEGSSSKAQPIDVPLQTQDTASTGTGSATSSSDGSPIEKLSAALEAAMLDRGRNRAQTPIQGNGPAAEQDWSTLLLPGEVIVFNSAVEAGSLRRRASRLLAMAVTPKRLSSRQLALTTHRLICLKQSRAGRGYGVKVELPFSSPDREKEDKEARCNSIIGVEAKGEREFVVMTTNKTHSFAADGPLLAGMWVQKIREELELHGHNRGRQPSVTRT